MGFWSLERHPADATALLAGGREYSYRQLAALSDAHVRHLPHQRRSVGFLGFAADVDLVALYLGALRSGRHVPLLLHPDISPLQLAHLAELYRPEWMAFPHRVAIPDGYAARRFGETAGTVLHVATAPDKTAAEPQSELALLLTTSGSTGSPKLVRLSYQSLASNAAAIAAYLGLRQEDRAIKVLPLSYSFGLSILNSHLEAGGSFVLGEESVMSRPFWEQARASGITSLSGVPATFEMLRRMDLERAGLAKLRMLTQAGGHMQVSLVQHFLDVCERLGLEFFVMYGQTEASPRISYVPPRRLREKLGSVGVPIPGGELEVCPETGELVYRGPNVMLGYAESRDDLALGDVQHGVLRTGDLAKMDEDGFFYITGRSKRFVKISGNRVSLDETEMLLGRLLQCQIACLGDDDNLIVFVTGGSVPDVDEVRRATQSALRMFLSGLRVVMLPELPLLPSGKVDYSRLAVLAGGRPA